MRRRSYQPDGLSTKERNNMNRNRDTRDIVDMLRDGIEDRGDFYQEIDTEKYEGIMEQAAKEIETLRKRIIYLENRNINRN